MNFNSQYKRFKEFRKTEIYGYLNDCVLFILMLLAVWQLYFYVFYPCDNCSICENMECLTCLELKERDLFVVNILDYETSSNFPSNKDMIFRSSLDE